MPSVGHNEHDDEPVEYLSGTRLAELLGVPEDTPLSAAIGVDAAVHIMNWVRTTLFWWHAFPDAFSTGTPRENPWIFEIPAIPVAMVVDVLAAAGATVPTRRQARDWLVAQQDLSEYDAELEVRAAELTVDPDLFDVAAGAGEARICGVPQSVFNQLTEPEKAKVVRGQVIAPLQAPTPVARRLARQVFAVRRRPPGARRRVWMSTLLRADQTWYQYAEHTAGAPPYWKAQTDPEWMRRRLRDALTGCWYVSSHTEKGQRIYDGLKWWNPDDRSLTQVENALADITATAAGGSGVGARELCDLYGRQLGAYRGGRLVLVRNGVLDVTTGALVEATPLWFDLTRIEAVYRHRDPIDGAAQWMSVLRAQWPDDPGSIGLLQQWFGYVISRRLDLQKFLWIYGESGTAKSLIAAVLEALIGNVTELGLDALNTPFGLQAAYEAGATLTVMSDVRFGSRDSSLAVARLLSIVGDDMVDIPRKYKAAIKDRLSVRFHGTSNELPKLSDHTDALIDRMLILETTRVFPRGGPDTDEGLPARIIADELGLVLRWAVEGLRGLDAAGGRFDKPARAEEMRTETAYALSNVRACREECATVVAAEDHKHAAGCGCVCVDAGALFRVWGKWAADNKSGERMSKAAFLRALKSLGGGVRPGQLLNGQRVVWGIEKAQTVYRDRDRFGLEVARIASTDPDVDGDPAGDNPFTPRRVQHPGAS